MLDVPVDDNDPELSGILGNLLARAYLHDEHSPVTELLHAHGLTDLPH